MYSLWSLLSLFCSFYGDATENSKDLEGIICRGPSEEIDAYRIICFSLQIFIQHYTSILEGNDRVLCAIPLLPCSVSVQLIFTKKGEPPARLNSVALGILLPYNSVKVLLEIIHVFEKQYLVEESRKSMHVKKIVKVLSKLGLYLEACCCSNCNLAGDGTIVYNLSFEEKTFLRQQKLKLLMNHLKEMEVEPLPLLDKKNSDKHIYIYIFVF